MNPEFRDPVFKKKNYKILVKYYNEKTKKIDFMNLVDNNNMFYLYDVTVKPPLLICKSKDPYDFDTIIAEERKGGK